MWGKSTLASVTFLKHQGPIDMHICICSAPCIFVSVLAYYFSLCAKLASPERSRTASCRSCSISPSVVKCFDYSSLSLRVGLLLANISC